MLDRGRPRLYSGPRPEPPLGESTAVQGEQHRRDLRGQPRAAVGVAGAVFGSGPDLLEIPLRTIDLSAGGALCHLEVSLQVGDPVRMRLDLTDDQGALRPVVLEAIVVRREGAGPFRVAFHFVDVPVRVRERLRRFVLHLIQAPGA